ncbi:restriction endonuclease subunit S [Acinetobacter sp. ANC 4173]|uniref:restriction endonuclease subunit S n=1 Tax=Acinetobacter sp. ANC 4173 TaxID=2529837 RepID=UPI00103BEA6E|nr:restriction endonuclease subunit S [Acinetobacter sp. ANC 4173]TCB81115.1 restriction endonuclease subunit S [Acinetobacter sp. ANC 4173]
MSQLPRYESYKDSGVQWLGEIPSHWKCLSIKRLTLVKRGASPRPIDNPEYFDDEGEYAWVRIADVTASDKYLLETTQRLSELGNSLSVKMQPDSIFLSIAGSVGKPIITKVKACIHDGFVYFPDWKESINFLYYIFASGQPYLGLGKLGTQLNLNTDTVGNIKIALPPSDEQEAIADFLDKRLAQVDSLITKQATLLEKLAEQRVALISHAVTKGLNPDVEMKESGIEILGNIPQQWKIKRLKFLLSEKLKYGANESAESEDKENPRYIRITDIDDSGNLKDETFKSLEFEKAEEYLLDDLDILLARSGATVGKSYLYKAESIGIACYAGYLIRARLDQENYNPEFVNYFLQSKQYWDWISSINIQATIQNVSAEKYNDLTLAIPPLEEQKQLIEYLKNEDEKFNSAIGKGKKLVHLLNEYRSTLITQVVTGKIDVRNLKLN